MYFCVIIFSMMKPGKYFIDFATESVNILVQPVKFWQGIKTDKNSINGVFSRFFLTGLVLIFLAIIIGDVIFESEYGWLMKDTLIKASRMVVFLLLAFFATTMIMYEVSRKFRIPVEFETARKITIYSMLPLVLVTIVTGVFPFLDVLGLISFYSLYLIYIALITLFELKPHRNITYFVVLLSSIFISYFLIAWLLSKLTALIIY